MPAGSTGNGAEVVATLSLGEYGRAVTRRYKEKRERK
jgi:hypothetical protein